MTFSIIGTGNIAWFFGYRLVAAKHRCLGVYSRNPQQAKVLAEELSAGRWGEIDEMNDGEVDVCLLAVSDAAINKVATILSLKHTMLLYAAGAVALDSISSATVDKAVLWPVYSILKNDLPVHRNIPCVWEATTPQAGKYVQEIGHALTDVLYEAGYGQRKWLHLSAVIGNNFINHLMAICAQVCAEKSLPFAVLQPIIEQTFERTKHIAPQSAQTGPAIRRDNTTIQNQLALIGDHPQWQKIYEAITASIQAGNSQ